MEIEEFHVELAYRKLKRYVYYDKNDLHLRHRVAEFECSKNFKKQLAAVRRVVNNNSPLESKTFKRWLSEIDFRVVPKSLSKEDEQTLDQSENEGRFISNVTSRKYFDVEKVNYFFDGPVELHLIAILWIMFEGRYLDARLGDECFGSRLSKSLNDDEDESANLFRKYHDLYARWRDTGIKKAKQLLVEDKTSVCILGLDVQEYFYRINLDFNSLANEIAEAKRDEDQSNFIDDSSSELLNCLEAVHVAYREKIESHLQDTHDGPPSMDTGIPIGLCTSSLLANWYLRPFDRLIKAKLKPAYYGRYVDDILLVVESSEDPSQSKQPIVDFIDDVLVRNKILRPPEGNRYEIRKPRGLHLQQSKCILQYFDVKHSIAGLEKFQKKLEENSSSFLLLPVDESDSTLENVAYELMYDGSVNKFRSIKGLAENRYELAKNLARQTMLHLLTDDPPNPEVSIGLRKFFKGRNAILFHDLWERVFTYFVIADDLKSADIFDRSLRAEINRLRMKSKGSISKALKSNLESHLRLSRSMSNALKVEDDPFFEWLEGDASFTIRRANLIRHHFIRLPLLNYTNYNGPLITRVINEKVEISPKKLNWSPRYVHFDECLLLSESGNLEDNQINTLNQSVEIYEFANGQSIEGIKWNNISIEMDNDNA